MSSQDQTVSQQLMKSGAGIELALSAAIFGLLGWWLDSKFGTTPAFLIGFFIFGFLGAVFALYFRFRQAMEQFDNSSAAKVSE